MDPPMFIGNTWATARLSGGRIGTRLMAYGAPLPSVVTHPGLAPGADEYKGGTGHGSSSA